MILKFPELQKKPFKMFLHQKPKREVLPISEKLWIIRFRVRNRLADSKLRSDDDIYISRSDDDIFLLEPVPKPENSETKSKKPKVQQKMTKYFSVNSGK